MNSVAMVLPSKSNADAAPQSALGGCAFALQVRNRDKRCRKSWPRTPNVQQSDEPSFTSQLSRLKSWVGHDTYQDQNVFVAEAPSQRPPHLVMAVDSPAIAALICSAIERVFFDKVLFHGPFHLS
jgi:hypothetical protein